MNTIAHKLIPMANADDTTSVKIKTSVYNLVKAEKERTGVSIGYIIEDAILKKLHVRRKKKLPF